MPKKLMSVAILGSAVLLGLTACAGQKEPTFGERLQGQGAEVQAIGTKWSKGDAMTVKGAKLLKAGEKEIAQGRAAVSAGESKVSQGNALISEGNKMKMDSEEAYRLRVGQHAGPMGVQPVR